MRNVRAVNLDSGLRHTIAALDGKIDVGTEAVGPSELNKYTQSILYAVEGADVRVRFDGTEPSATVGLPLKDGSTGTMSHALWQAAKWIAQSGTGKIWYTELAT